MKKITSTTLKILIPLLISAVILYFTYRDYDFSKFWADMKRIDWRWLAAALAFSAFGPLFWLGLGITFICIANRKENDKKEENKEENKDN